MAFTPILWKSQTQVNASDSGVQNDGQIAATQDGGYVVVWQSINFIIGQRYDSAGNKLNSEVIAGFNSGQQTAPAVTVLANGNIAVAFVDVPAAEVYVQIFAPTWGLPAQAGRDRWRHGPESPLHHPLRRRQLRRRIYRGHQQCRDQRPGEDRERRRRRRHRVRPQ